MILAPVDHEQSELVELSVDGPVWDRFFTVAPLVLVGTTDANGALDFAPKHMVTPMGWQNYFGFICSPEHSTCINIGRTGVFTVSYPKPSQMLFASLAASPRTVIGTKPVLDYFETFPAKHIDASFVEHCQVYFECRQFKTIDGFGDNCLIAGEIVAARADPAYLRSNEIDDQELLRVAPLLTYLAPGRFATVETTNAFPFPANMQK